LLDLVRLPASLGKVQQEQHIRDEFLSTPVALGDEFPPITQ
jgi:hypothetical protein